MKLNIITPHGTHPILKYTCVLTIFHLSSVFLMCLPELCPGPVDVSTGGRQLPLEPGLHQGEQQQGQLGTSVQ